MPYQVLVGMMADGKTKRKIQVDSEGRLVVAPVIMGDWVQLQLLFADSTTISKVLDLKGEYDRLDIEIPTIDSATIAVHSARTAGGTFRKRGNSAVVAASTGAFHTALNLGGFCKYIKIVFGSAQTADRTLWIRPWRSEGA